MGQNLSKILDFRNFFEKKMEAKNKMIFGRLKNRILRPQEQIAEKKKRRFGVNAGVMEPQKQTADEARRSVRIRGKEHRMGGMPLSQESEA